MFQASLQIYDPGMAAFAAQVRDGQPLEPVLAQLIDIVEKPAAKPITDEEVERARTQILKQIELNLNSSENVGLVVERLGRHGRLAADVRATATACAP